MTGTVPMENVGAIRGIGFVGTGIMGGHMARRLAEAGLAVAAWSCGPEKARALARFGVGHAPSARDVASQADALLCMRSFGPVCDEVLFGEEGAARALTPGAVLLVMSLIAPDMPCDCVAT